MSVKLYCSFISGPWKERLEDQPIAKEKDLSATELFIEKAVKLKQSFFSGKQLILTYINGLKGVSMLKRFPGESSAVKKIFILCTIFSALVFFTISAHAAIHAPYTNAPQSFADLVAKVQNSVVNVSTTQTIKTHRFMRRFGPHSPFNDFFGNNFDDFFERFFGEIPQGKIKTRSLGSGVIIDKTKGYILTNNHVVAKADEIKVRLTNDKSYDAKIVGRDPKTDIALIQVKKTSELPEQATLGDSDKLRVGDWVFAIGNPFGLGHTVTAGIISAKGRIIGAGPYDDFLQTDAAINPGNSGGPLFNMKGEVIGINTAIVAHGQGIGFAIPSNMAKAIVDQLIKTGKVVRGWLGVMIQEITPDLAESIGYKGDKGALVADVLEEGPAKKAGLKRGDIVLKFNGRDIDSAHTLSRVVSSTSPGEKVKVKIWRNGEEKTLKVKIATMPENAGEMVGTATEWGFKVQTLTPELAEEFGWPSKEKGVIVTEVDRGTPASMAGLKKGDLIKEVNKKSVKNLRQYNKALQSNKKKSRLLLLVKRGYHTFYMLLEKQ